MKKAFIVFEGCEGVGKSTQLRLLAEYMKKTNQETVFTREPGGTSLAEKIRDLILTEKMDAECEALLFAAARSEHINQLILPALNDGKIVVCDRYIHSSIAYQGYGRDLGYDRVIQLNRCAVTSCMPDAVIFLDMNPLESWRRQKGTVIPNDRLEQEKDEFHLKVYHGYKEAGEKDDRFIPIVPSQSKIETAQRIVSALRERSLIL